MPWGFIVLLIGILYGYLSPGRQDKMRLFRNGLVIGIVLGLVFALLGSVAGFHPLGLGAGVVAIVLGVVVLTVLFVLGAWIGDFLEGAPRRT